MYHDGTHQLGRVEYKIIGGSRLLEKGGIRRTLVDLTFGKENLPIHTHLHAKQRLKNYFCFFQKGGLGTLGTHRNVFKSRINNRKEILQVKLCT